MQAWGKGGEGVGYFAPLRSARPVAAAALAPWSPHLRPPRRYARFAYDAHHSLHTPRRQAPSFVSRLWVESRCRALFS